MKKLLSLIVSLAVLLYGGAGAYLYLAQRQLQYFPDPERVSPQSVGLDSASEETLVTRDGETLVLWWAPPTSSLKPVYLYLHGNGRNLAAHAERYKALIADGSGLMALSWRGYGGSTGTPTEPGLRIDARAAYDMLAARVPPERIVILGESLGSTLAVMLASEVKAGALVLDSGFGSAASIGAARYPWLPVRWLMADQYNADAVASRIRMPTLMVHCRVDPTIPLPFGEALQRQIPGAEPLVVLDKSCHPTPTADFMPALRPFLAKLFPG